MNEAEITYQITLNKLMHYCNYKERCEKEVREKINKLDVDPDWTDKIVDYLKELDYLNNVRFATAFIHSKFKYNKWGNRKISYELSRKGFSTSEINQLLRAEELDFEANLMSLLRNKQKILKPGLDKLQQRAKLYRFAIAKGYDTSSINHCLENLL